MSSDWQIMSLKEANVSLIDCLHKTPTASDDGYPYVAIPQLKGGRIDLSGVRRISKELFDEWTRKVKPETDDVILSRRCNPGETGFVPPDLDCALGQNLVLLRSDGSKVHPPFLRWLVRSPNWWEQVNKFMNVGALFNSLKCADIPKFELPIPPIDVQRNIAEFLGALDDKIELNRQINQIIEQIAQAIFKSWFIDFAPVKAKFEAKVSGRDPENSAMYAISGRTGEYLDELLLEHLKQLAYVAHSFPDELEESVFGLIPRGWRWSTIGKEVDVVGGGTPNTGSPEYWTNGTYNWTTPRDLSRISDKILLKTEKKLTKAGIERISSGLLPVDTVLLSSRAPVGYLALAKIPVAINQGYIAMKCNKRLPPTFVLQWTNSVMNDIKQRASGTTFAEISKKNFRAIPILIPSEALINEYGRITDTLYQIIKESISESNSLSAIRDLLLPQLLSGEIDLVGA